MAAKLVRGRSMELNSMSILFGLTPAVNYKYHTDSQANPKGTTSHITFILSVGPGKSTFHVATAEEHAEFADTGAFHSFPSALYHRSGTTNNLVVKLVLFYKVTMKESDLEQDKLNQASVKQEQAAEAAEGQPTAGALTPSSESPSSTTEMKPAVEVNSKGGERDDTSDQDAKEAPEGDKTIEEGEDAAESAQDDAQHEDKAVSPVLSSMSASAPEAVPAKHEEDAPADPEAGVGDQQVKAPAQKRPRTTRNGAHEARKGS
jgi:hypothetical protein